MKTPAQDREYVSGEIVEPGTYLDVTTGAVVQVQERDELPDGSRMIHYSRRFRRVAADELDTVRCAAGRR